MAEKRIFVGREDELEQFHKVLEDPQGQAVLVVGQAGMGKTWLVNEMAERMENKSALKCFSLRYEVTPTDPANTVMTDIMNDAADAIDSVRNKARKYVERNKQKLAALFGTGGLIPIVGSRVKAIGDLAISLTERDKAGNVRKQFIDVLKRLSDSMPDEGRVIFIIDPEKYMQEKSDQSWAIVVKQLPERIKFVFAQRPEDALIDSETFEALDNVVRVPEKRIGVLEEESVDELLVKRSKGLKHKVTKLRQVLSRYKGHPYALGAALDLIEGGIKLEDLPERPEPTEFAEAQWREVSNRSEDAIRLFKGYAILEVGVTDDVVEAVSELNSDKRQHLLSDKYLHGLLREEGEGRRIYHAILADYIVGQIGEGEKKEYHGRAVGVYREKLKKAKKKQTKPDALAAMRLPEHVLEAEGEEAFVDAFVNECGEVLINLGFLDSFINLSERALDFAEKGSKEEAMVAGNLGLIYRKRGDLDKAEEMHKKALEIAERLELKEVMASNYGNLGNVYFIRGDLDKAEEMHKKSLEINKKMGRLKGMAGQYGNLGLIYQTRGDLDKAEEMFREGLKIEEKLGLLEGMAAKYGNLGLIYRTRGELDKAEEMHKKTLEIEKKLGRLEGMASDYAALGLVCAGRGDLEKAEEWHQKGLEIEEKIGRLAGIARQYGNLGNVYFMRGELDKAEEMFTKILDIHKKLGHQVGMANDYSNLGLVYEQRGDVKKAREYWEKALGLFKKIRMPHMVKEVEGWIKSIDK